MDGAPQKPLWQQKQLLRIDHRLIWWFLAHMRDDGMVSHGWRQRAMLDLRIPNSTLFESQVRLKAIGAIRFHKYQRALWVCAEPFTK